jgi:DNA-binding transcriptional ArsR family regulator
MRRQSCRLFKDVRPVPVWTLSEEMLIAARAGLELRLRRAITYSQLAMQHQPALDRTFRALSDHTRRSMIHVLAQGDTCSASELGRRFSSAQPTISKHLKVLEEAGLVARTIEGRVHRFRLRRKPLRDAEAWLSRHQAFWTGAVAQLDRLLSERHDDEP